MTLELPPHLDRYSAAVVTSYKQQKQNSKKYHNFISPGRLGSDRAASQL